MAWTCCGHAQQGIGTPVISTDGTGTDGDRVQGLRLGADDHLPNRLIWTN